jgi:NhaP-type Na+/H+ or K+/H+ antiporter
LATSIAELVLVSLLAAWLLGKLRIPGLVGMLLAGVVFGPYVLGWLDAELLAVGQDLRLIALIVILLRAGFELSRSVLHRVGGRALVLAFFPAVVEVGAITLLGPPLLGLSVMASAVLGGVLAAVSPAVVVPLMIRFIQQRRGAEKGIPTMVLAASSVDDVFVIVLYSVLIGFYTGSEANWAWQLAGIPISIVLGVAVGLTVGVVLYRLFERFNPRATKRVLVVVAVSVLLFRLEHVVSAWVPFAALVAAMAIGVVFLERRERMAHEISAKLGKVWVLAEILLFTLVGAQVNLPVAWRAGLAGAGLIAAGLVARSVGTWLCLLGSDLDAGERLFVIVAYLPKATVQAAIGAGPLMAMRAAGMPIGPGEIILAVAVLSIVLTAPTGAWAIALLGPRTLQVAPADCDAARTAAVESQSDDLPGSPE